MLTCHGMERSRACLFGRGNKSTLAERTICVRMHFALNGRGIHILLMGEQGQTPQAMFKAHIASGDGLCLGGGYGFYSQ